MGKIAFLFAGQGSQYPGMGKDLYDGSQEIRELYDMAESYRGDTIRQCFSSEKEELQITRNTQPCLYLTDLACAMAVESKGIHPDMAAGFSLGEIVGLTQTGIFDKKDSFKLVCKRAELMDDAGNKNKGGMLAVLRMDTKELEDLCADYNVYPVNYNCPGQIAVSGGEKEIEEFGKVLKEKGVRAVPLAVSGPFHTPYMKDATEGLKDMLLEMSPETPKIPLYGNMKAVPYPDDKDGIIENISKQVSNSVKWEDTIRNMHDDGADIFVECGPGKVLSSLVKKTLSDVLICNVSDVESLDKTVADIQAYREEK